MSAHGGQLLAITIRAGNRWGRVTELVCAACCHLVCAVGAFAATSPLLLLTWRLLGGVGMGLSLHAGTIYIAGALGDTCTTQLVRPLSGP